MEQFNVNAQPFRPPVGHHQQGGSNNGTNQQGGSNGGTPSHARGAAMSQAKLFVGQLPFECTEERLHELFSAYGTVEGIHILRDTFGRSKGAAFVTYSCVEEADCAIFTLHNRYRMLTNHAVQVSYAKNSPNISTFGQCSAWEVHNQHPSNPLPDLAF